MNDILLDKVNCTEIDLRRTGFVNELIDMGDVAITFDRPTRQEEFVLKDIESSYRLGIFLTKQLLDHKGTSLQQSQTIWLRNPSAKEVITHGPN